jgi:hypothetical protein
MKNGDRDTRRISWAAGALVVAALLFTANGVAAQGSDSRTSIRRPTIAGKFIDAASGEGAFSGNLDLGHFEMRQNFLVIVGTLSGVLSESRGQVIGRVNEEIVVPVVVVESTCQLLHLDVGPLDLDLQGVHVQFDKNALGITTRDGPSQNLLCSTAKFLGTRPTLDAVAARLNAVLGTLNASK